MKPREQEVYFDDLAQGQELPPATKQANRTQLFLFSAATWNPHRIHYDRDYAATEGHPDVLVHGPLQGAWLAQYVTDWMGPLGRLQKLEWQNRGRAFPDQPYVIAGTVAEVDAASGTVRLDLRQCDSEGNVLMPGTAVVALPRR
jgi:hydroxyacyl-ACP dehydratase HTD2-like protein with hotdog domain